MTPRVHTLDAVTASRIAAGEVIERPASVVKELLDNALDAGSSRVDIDLRNGGRRLIQVTDNGCGMPATDAQLALQRFTTSKIRCLEDLRGLTTLGFRGEALASMTAVAQVDVYTRPAGQPEGALVQSRGHGEAAIHPAGCPVGTRVCVHHLLPFFGQAHVGYLPGERLVGLSKIGRVIDAHARRLQTQERLTAAVVRTLDSGLVPRGVIALLRAEHTCMTCRGARKEQGRMLTMASSGIYDSDPAARREILSLIEGTTGLANDG